MIILHIWWWKLRSSSLKAGTSSHCPSVAKKIFRASRSTATPTVTPALSTRFPGICGHHKDITTEPQTCPNMFLSRSFKVPIKVYLAWVPPSPLFHLGLWNHSTLSLSLVPSRADWRLHFRTSYYSTFQMFFSNWLHATARKRPQPCPPLACQTWLQERLPCIWYHINTSCPTIHTQ